MRLRPGGGFSRTAAEYGKKALMAKKITRGAADFAALFDSLVLPTSTIRLCMDSELVAEREQAQAALDAATLAVESESREYSMAEGPADVSALQARLDEIDERIDASDATTILEVRAPSETDMAGIQHFYDDHKMDEWQVAIVALCLGQDEKQVRALRGHITRGSWRLLWTQCVELVSEGAAAVPTRRPGSASAQG